jgi:PAS domain S-box-containing protein
MRSNQFRALIEHSADAIWMLAEPGTILYASPASEQMLGYTPEELTGANAFDFFLPSDRQAARERLSQPRGEAVAFRLRRKDGVIVWANVAGANLLAEPDIEALVLSLRDVTESRRAEQLVRENEKRFRALIENSADGFVLLDREGRVIYSGPAVLGYPQGVFEGRGILEIVHPDDLERACSSMADMAAHPGKCLTAEYRALHADGSWRWMEATAKNLLSDPVVKGMVVNYRDTTERKRHEEEIQRARDEVRHILESIQESFIALDREWRFTYVNQRVAGVIGKAPAELIGENLWEVFPEARHTDFYPQYQRVMTERVPVQFEMRYPSTGRWFDVHAYPTEEGLSAYILDITQRKHAERHASVHRAVTRILSESSTLAEIAPRIMRAVGEELGWPVATFWKVDARRAVLRYAESWKAAKGSRGKFAKHCREWTFQKGEGLPGVAWAEGRTTWVADIAESDIYARTQVAATEGLRAAFAFPLFRGADVAGVLEFLSPEPRERDPELMQLMDTIAVQIGHFLERKAQSRAAH